MQINHLIFLWKFKHPQQLWIKCTIFQANKKYMLLFFWCWSTDTQSHVNKPPAGVDKVIPIYGKKHVVFFRLPYIRRVMSQGKNLKHQLSKEDPTSGKCLIYAFMTIKWASMISFYSLGCKYNDFHCFQWADWVSALTFKTTFKISSNTNCGKILDFVF